MLKILFFVLFFAVISFFGLKYLVGIKLKKYAKITNQRGIFAFDSIILPLGFLSIELQNTSLIINPISIFTASVHLIWVKIGKIIIKEIENPEKVEKLEKNDAKAIEKESISKLDEIQRTFMITFLHSIIHKFAIYFDEIVLNLPSKGVNFATKDIHLIYTRDKGSYVEFAHDTITFSYQKLGDFIIDPATFRLHIDAISLLKSIGMKQYLFNMIISHTKFVLETSQNHLKINSFTIQPNFNPGLITLEFPEIKVQLPFKLPLFKLSFDELKTQLIYPFAPVKNIEFNELFVKIIGIKISSISDDFFTINEFSIKKKLLLDANEKPVFLIDKVALNYNSLDGMELFQIVPEIRSDSTEPTRINFDFPDLDFTINSINAILKFTDKCVVSASSENFTFKNRKAIFPIVRGYLNNVPMIKGHNLQLFSQDKTFLDIQLDKACFHHRNKVNVADFIDNIVYGYYLIKPYVSRGLFDSETLPFPLRIKADLFQFKVDDDAPNASLIQIVKKIPTMMKESVVLKYILNLKMEQCHLTDQQKEKANHKLGDLIFQNYRKAIGVLELKKKVYLSATGIVAELDSRDFTGMVGKLQTFDPAVKEFYPNAEWETLEGLQAEGKLDKLEISCFDLPDPIITAEGFRVKGPIVFAEVKCNDMVDIDFTVNDKQFTVRKSAADLKFYSDLYMSASEASIIYGNAMLKTYDAFGDVFSTLFPDGVDPSPPLKWWDKLRSMFRGKYTFAIEIFMINLLGSRNQYDTRDVMNCVLTKANVVFEDEVSRITTDMFQAYRGHGGPLIIYFPKFTANVTFTWQQDNEDKRKHLMIPDVTKFNDPDYDTYAPFRSKGFDVDMELDFQSGEFTPYISVDYAHLEWLISPIMLYIDTDPLEEAYAKKYGIKLPKPTALMYLSELNQVYTIRFNVPVLSCRCFDHFPAVDKTTINGTSCDISFTQPNFHCRMEFPREGESEFDIGIISPAIHLNATDLADYAKTTEVLTTNIVEILDLEARYGVTSKVSVSSIKVYLNQILAMYISEFTKSIIHIMNKKAAQKEAEKNKSKQKQRLSQTNPSNQYEDEDSSSQSTSFSQSSTTTTTTTSSDTVRTNSTKGQDLLTHLMRRRSDQRLASVFGQNKQYRRSTKIDNLDEYPVILFSATVPLLKVIVESMTYETNLLAIIRGAKFDFRENAERTLYAAEAQLQTASIYHNFDFYQNEEDLPRSMANIDTIKLIYHQTFAEQWHDNLLDIEVDQVTANVNTNQFAIIKQLFSEVMPEIPKDEKKLAMAAEDYFSLKIAIELGQGQLELRDQFSVEVAVAVLSKTSCNINMSITGTTETVATIDNVFINDVRKEARYNGIVLMRWMDLTSADSPHLRVQMRSAPPVGGISIYNQVEFNLDPTTFNYDAEFANAIETMLTSSIIAPRVENVSKYIKSNQSIQLPPVLIPLCLLPPIVDEWTEFLMKMKSSEINIMVERAERNFLIRYFKVTDVKMNVSYRNEDNSIISEINEFNGELHDIIYQDLTTSFKGIVSKLIGTITLDMIPQFLKHLIGLGKISPAKEYDLKQWLNDNHADAMAKKKQLIFGKSQK